MTRHMELNDYQRRAMETAIYPNVGANLTYPVLKLASEAGEVAGKLGKAVRDGYPEDFNSQMAAELGDVLWYVAACAHEIGYTLNDIADMNLAKLADRQTRGVLKGSGDNR